MIFLGAVLLPEALRGPHFYWGIIEYSQAFMVHPFLTFNLKELEQALKHKARAAFRQPAHV